MSGIIQRGEEIFPFNVFHSDIDWNRVLQMMEKMPVDGTKLMGTDEILELYE